MIQAEETITVAVFDEHELYLKYSQNYRVGWAVLNEAAKNANIALQSSPQVWARAISGLETGKFDFVYGAAYTEDRAVWAGYSLPLFFDSTQIFARKASTKKTIDDINKDNDIVGVSKDSINHTFAKSLGFRNIYAIANRGTIFNLLMQERIDYMITIRAFIEVYCNTMVAKQFDECVSLVGEPISFHGGHLMHTQKNVKASDQVARLNQEIWLLIDSDKARAIFYENGLSAQDYQYWRSNINESNVVPRIK